MTWPVTTLKGSVRMREIPMAYDFPSDRELRAALACIYREHDGLTDAAAKEFAAIAVFIDLPDDCAAVLAQVTALAREYLAIELLPDDISGRIARVRRQSVADLYRLLWLRAWLRDGLQKFNSGKWVRPADRTRKPK